MPDAMQAQTAYVERSNGSFCPTLMASAVGKLEDTRWHQADIGFAHTCHGLCSYSSLRDEEHMPLLPPIHIVGACSRFGMLSHGPRTATVLPTCIANTSRE